VAGASWWHDLHRKLGSLAFMTALGAPQRNLPVAVEK
jgi:hypothetical protein